MRKTPSSLPKRDTHPDKQRFRKLIEKETDPQKLRQLKEEETAHNHPNRDRDKEK